MEDIKDEIVDYLSRKKFVILATSTPDGKPLTHTLAYVNKGPIIYFSTYKNSRKTKNIQDNPNVAYSVFNETEHLDEIRSVQMEGTATLISDKKETNKILEELGQKFPTMTHLISHSDNLIIKITPKTCYFTDYVKHAGVREKVEYL
jgi:nitroimidazol reductase NimA-like FMN-containing flavoprotein (pyridoxamine 5'-phosphate oxidase superfamily)